MNLGGVTEDQREARGHLGLEANILGKGALGDRLHFSDDLGQVHRHARTLGATAEREHLFDEVGAAFRAALDILDHPQAPLVGIEPLEDAHSHDDRHEQVVHVVGDAARECADAFHALSTQELLFELLALSDVRLDAEDRFRLTLPIAHQSPSAVHGQHGTGNRGPLHFSTPLTFPEHDLLCGLELGVVDLEQLIATASQGIGSGPAIDPFRTLAPENDPVAEIAYENGIAGLVDQSRLLCKLLFRGAPPGQVSHATDHAQGVAGCIPGDVCAVEDIAERAVLSLNVVLVGPTVPPLLEDLADSVHDPLTVVAIDQVAPRFEGLDLMGKMAEQSSQAFVPPQLLSGEVQVPNRVIADAGNLPETLFTGVGRLQGLTELVDIGTRP